MSSGVLFNATSVFEPCRLVKIPSSSSLNPSLKAPREKRTKIERMKIILFAVRVFFSFHFFSGKKRKKTQTLPLSYRPPTLFRTAGGAGEGASSLLVAPLTSSLIIIRIAAAKMLCEILVESPSKNPRTPSAA